MLQVSLDSASSWGRPSAQHAGMAGRSVYGQHNVHHTSPQTISHPTISSVAAQPAFLQHPNPAWQIAYRSSSARDCCSAGTNLGLGPWIQAGNRMNQTEPNSVLHYMPAQEMTVHQAYIISYIFGTISNHIL